MNDSSKPLPQEVVISIAAALLLRSTEAAGNHGAIQSTTLRTRPRPLPELEDANGDELELKRTLKTKPAGRNENPR